MSGVYKELVNSCDEDYDLSIEISPKRDNVTLCRHRNLREVLYYLFLTFLLALLGGLVIFLIFTISCLDFSWSNVENYLVNGSPPIYMKKREIREEKYNSTLVFNITLPNNTFSQEWHNYPYIENADDIDTDSYDSYEDSSEIQQAESMPFVLILMNTFPVKGVIVFCVVLGVYLLFIVFGLGIRFLFFKCQRKNKSGDLETGEELESDDEFASPGPPHTTPVQSFTDLGTQPLEPQRNASKRDSIYAEVCNCNVTKPLINQITPYHSAPVSTPIIIPGTKHWNSYPSYPLSPKICVLPPSYAVVHGSEVGFDCSRVGLNPFPRIEEF